MDAPRIVEWVGAALAPLQVGVCALALVRRLWKTLPYFTAYLVLVVLVEGLRWGVIFASGVNSPTHQWTYWMTQPALILARGAALADICRAALGLYTGVWKLARLLLVVSGTFMLAFAAVHTNEAHRVSSYLLFLERELEFAVLISLMLILVLVRYYGLSLERPLDGIALGLGFYSSIVIISSSILIGSLSLPWWGFSLARSLGYAGALGMWAYALRAPVRERARPELGTVENYEAGSREIRNRMRELNDRLSDLMK
ncbi:MAG TPA: hypothetical protein VLW54_04910 [Candidatus Acidoferrales bacterium]|nr:hypothetical protein [Candidatus Acidoferrales bacterium]